mmetsp:Transcript_29851/g.87106  ORF Transcript_29851/g.87106 Transcript_29851/m.87106 type:complete len:97 (-) Transcript_29851:568-858(-)
MSAFYTIIAVVVLVAALVYVHRRYVRISLPAGTVMRQECLPEEGRSEAEMVDDDEEDDDDEEEGGGDDDEDDDKKDNGGEGNGGGGGGGNGGDGSQ